MVILFFCKNKSPRYSYKMLKRRFNKLIVILWCMRTVEHFKSKNQELLFVPHIYELALWENNCESEFNTKMKKFSAIHGKNYI